MDQIDNVLANFGFTKGSFGYYFHPRAKLSLELDKTKQKLSWGDLYYTGGQGIETIRKMLLRLISSFEERDLNIAIVNKDCWDSIKPTDILISCKNDKLKRAAKECYRSFFEQSIILLNSQFDSPEMENIHYEHNFEPIFDFEQEKLLGVINEFDPKKSKYNKFLVFDYNEGNSIKTILDNLSLQLEYIFDIKPLKETNYHMSFNDSFYENKDLDSKQSHFTIFHKFLFSNKNLVLKVTYSYYSNGKRNKKDFIFSIVDNDFKSEELIKAREEFTKLNDITTINNLF